MTRGLSTDFPERVRTTPISEGAIAGISAGLALAGYRPIAEIMFGDFLTLCFDQVVNHIAKYEAMYDGQATCPVIFRTPSGGGRGYGPTHSQSLEKHFLGVPHLRVVAASLRPRSRARLRRAARPATSPVLYIEHKLLYPLHAARTPDDRGCLAERMRPADGAPRGGRRARTCTLTVAGLRLSGRARRGGARRLAVEEEIFGELLVPAQIAPTGLGADRASVAVTGAC